MWGNHRTVMCCNISSFCTCFVWYNWHDNSPVHPNHQYQQQHAHIVMKIFFLDTHSASSKSMPLYATVGRCTTRWRLRETWLNRESSSGWWLFSKTRTKSTLANRSHILTWWSHIKKHSCQLCVHHLMSNAYVYIYITHPASEKCFVSCSHSSWSWSLLLPLL